MVLEEIMQGLRSRQQRSRTAGKTKPALRANEAILKVEAFAMHYSISSQESDHARLMPVRYCPDRTHVRRWGAPDRARQGGNLAGANGPDHRAAAARRPNRRGGTPARRKTRGAVAPARHRGKQAGRG